jgi:hypothetical protein
MKGEYFAPPPASRSRSVGAAATHARRCDCDPYRPCDDRGGGCSLPGTKVFQRDDGRDEGPRPREKDQIGKRSLERKGSGNYEMWFALCG